MIRIRILAAFVTLLVLVPSAPAQAAARCFANVPGINNCIDGRLRTFWEQQGGLPVFGYPIGPQHAEQTSVGTVQVQQFERARLELHPENPAPYDVLLGRLGADALNGATPAPETPRAGCRFFAETQLNVCGSFLRTWRRYGLDLGQPGMTEAENLALFGLPLTPPQQATLSDGRSYTVQWFERARFEDHGAQGVMLGLLGSEQGGQAQPQQPTTAASNVTESSAGGFIKVSGNQLTLNGQPVQIKGANYYTQWRPWADMWAKWDGPQVERELTQGHNDLGLNAVRVLMPYDTRKDGTVEPYLVRRLQETAQIAGKLNMRLIVSLFDFDQDFPGGRQRPGGAAGHISAHIARAVYRRRPYHGVRISTTSRISMIYGAAAAHSRCLAGWAAWPISFTRSTRITLSQLHRRRTMRCGRPARMAAA